MNRKQRRFQQRWLRSQARGEIDAYLNKVDEIAITRALLTIHRSAFDFHHAARIEASAAILNPATPLAKAFVEKHYPRRVEKLSKRIQALCYPFADL